MVKHNTKSPFTHAIQIYYTVSTFAYTWKHQVPLGEYYLSLWWFKFVIELHEASYHD